MRLTLTTLLMLHHNCHCTTGIIDDPGTVPLQPAAFALIVTLQDMLIVGPCVSVTVTVNEQVVELVY